MKRCTPPDMIEGPEAFTRFNTAMSKILSVSKEELLRRETEYKRKADASPRKRGPKKRKAA